MRVLRFIVEDQIIRQDPNCDFSGLVPGSSGLVRAEFSFSSEWNDIMRVVAFYSNLGKEYTPRVLGYGEACTIPEEALANYIFKVQVKGIKSGMKVETNKIEVYQKGV